MIIFALQQMDVGCKFEHFYDKYFEVLLDGL
ncbi:MAG: hypothetical protein A4E23_01749 [Methanomethylovorans sp. PtaU1.Bin073]|nr:MAG: hypothetical protein A4E23_01749 [Methanomethylovorans sp. PtaU1.Bin073]